MPLSISKLSSTRAARARALLVLRGRRRARRAAAVGRFDQSVRRSARAECRGTRASTHGELALGRSRGVAARRAGRPLPAQLRLGRGAAALPSRRRDRGRLHERVHARAARTTRLPGDRARAGGLRRGHRAQRARRRRGDRSGRAWERARRGAPCSRAANRSRAPRPRARDRRREARRLHGRRALARGRAHEACGRAQRRGRARPRPLGQSVDGNAAREQTGPDRADRLSRVAAVARERGPRASRVAARAYERSAPRRYRRRTGTADCLESLDAAALLQQAATP